MNVLAKLRSGSFLGGVLAAGLIFYGAYLHLRVSNLQREMEALRQEKEALQSLLAERDEEKALQKKLQEQLRQFADQQETKQHQELLRLRQQVQQIPILTTQNEQLKERIKELQSWRVAAPAFPARGSDLLSGSPPLTQTYPAQGGALIPPGMALTNVALGKKVTTSAAKVYQGALAQITDGLKGPATDQLVILLRGIQWVQIDLEQEYSLYAIVLWHEYRSPEKFHDVVVQAAEDPEFKTNVRTLFNNDTDNSSGLGPGGDKEYIETKDGKTISAQNVKTRYLRFYSRGSDISTQNVYQEIEVYALSTPSLASGDPNF